MWPPLPSVGFISGRPANENDVGEGNAIFVMRSGENIVGLPIAIEIPQYALHKDLELGTRAPCIVLQAEESLDQQLVGIRYLHGGIGVGFLSEFELLGTTTPPLDF